MNRSDQLSVIASSDLFDALWYLEHNTDVACAGREPHIHYYDDGAKEGRDPSANFCTKFYLEKYSDVEQSGLNPLVHFVTIGRVEGRVATPDKYWLLTRDNGKQAEYLEITKSDLFDKEWYIENYMIDLDPCPDPIMHYLIEGSLLGYNPSQKFDTSFYLSEYPDIAAAAVNPLVHYLVAGRREGRLPLQPIESLTDFLISHNHHSIGLRTYNDIPSEPRVYLLTESITKLNFFGGLATALIVLTLFARRIDARIILLVKNDDTDLSLYNVLLKCHQILPPYRPIEIINVARKSGMVAYCKSDIFISTSWWTTSSLINSVPSNQIFYLIQEDERLFYPNNHAHANATQILKNKEIFFIVNSRLLHSYLSGEDLFFTERNSVWFEPAFPEKAYSRLTQMNGRRQFAFYARPKTDRNLFVRGLEALQSCFASEYFDDSWDFTFFGSNIPKIRLPNSRIPTILENLRWDDYLDYVRTVDLCLSLMYTPHPSYPPLDIAACGGVAVTNTFGNKTDLSQYSGNIICRPLDIDSLAQGIFEGIKLTLDVNARTNNYKTQGLSRDWEISLSGVISKMYQRYHEL